ncbi:phosphatidylinositol-3,5-bisphosphate 3-phosphatase MTMR6 [Lepeophtheirus salmonis]|uniref:phosphatidylinositol-3,5-bisphosphate 3-phosphatase MTMR6 n=1 Tax=Lepeophtheirus salmonis TaxID=72036 RepID=UPI001AE452CA|nr:myotubularin-related protein 6-like [Lepeophtheirus salmonis]
MEHIRTPKVEKVKLLNRYNPRSSPFGTLYLTTTHLIFVSNNGVEDSSTHCGASSSLNDASKELWILHMQMHTVEKPTLSTSGSILRVYCWNFLHATFVIPKDKDAQEIYLSLMELSRPKVHCSLFCFSYNPKGELSRRRSGWFFHDLSSEFQRLGIPNAEWTLNQSLNDDYSLCQTYPQTLIVPSSASLSLLKGSAAFRARSRLPVLTYLHRQNGAAIIRCAQPLVGIAGSRSAADEAYVELLRKASPNPKPLIYVLDTRPQINAMANKAGGKGYENGKFYENIKFFFKGIDNIHKMRSSLDKLVSSIVNTSNMNEFLGELSNSGWLKHIKAVLECAVAVVNVIVKENSSIIIHCSDGWDRTSQACSLAGLMLDPYYRTVTGFQALIEKDWLAFGHKFEDRCGHLNGDPHEVSPIFAQFLDCVWQLMNMFPQSFQFNERYLITIHEHVYSKQYGTFFGNSDRQRKEAHLEEKTYSLWGYIALHHDDYTNPLFDEEGYHVIQPEITSQRILFWSGLYSRFEEGSHPREPIIDLLSITQSHTSSLEDHGRQLSATISNVKSIISSAKAGGKLLSNIVSGTSSSSVPSQSSAYGSNGASSVTPTPSITAIHKDHQSNNSTQEMEKRFAELKTSIVEKCQSSKT